MATSGPNMVSQLWNQFQTSGTITRKIAKVAAEHRNLHRIATCHKAHDDIGGQRLLSLIATFLFCLEEEFPGKLFTAVLQRLAFTPGVQSGASL
ncbi:hypothetical protein TNCV_282941 [Trichonephila clavipes]|nr:hypothetical protein TNCV_282941 [Trichonephila clavipes]